VSLPPPRSDALAAARRALFAHRLVPAFLGHVRSEDRTADRQTLLAVLERGGASEPPTGAAPEEFRVVAIVPTYDEEDVVAQTLRDLIGQGLDAYLVDNWSTDATVERARPFLGRGLLAIERFPPDGPSPTYDLRALLGRVEAVAEGLPWASWVMLHDADERRRSPWPGTRLRDALWHVDRSGFSCVDHVTLSFWPTDDGFDPAGPDLEERFGHFEFSDHPGHFHQRRAWKQLGQRVALAPSAGHDVAFSGRRVYPYRFLLKHYPIRSRAQGERKLRDRRLRWNAQERALGWHRQYDALPSPAVVREPSSLRWFDPASFYEEFLIERLSAAGVFDAPPPWATPPRW
jgi:glycosyltransferase involved in cell wall biosynthesis